jgi:hypothetical protein
LAVAIPAERNCYIGQSRQNVSQADPGLKFKILRLPLPAPRGSIGHHHRGEAAAMKAKTATAKRQAVAKVFGSKHPVDSKHLNFLHARRHLATVRDGAWREPRYIVEFSELEHAIWIALDHIRERDGLKIFKEVADRLLDSVAASIEDNGRRTRRADNRSAVH